MKTQKYIQKTITLPKNLLRDVESRASRMGISIPEYFRFLALKDTEILRENSFNLTPEQEKDVNKSIKDFKLGKYQTASSAKEIEEILN